MTTEIKPNASADVTAKGLVCNDWFGDFEESLRAAGFMLETIGPTRPRCAAHRGAWSSREYDGYPHRWDRVFAEAQTAWPTVLPNNKTEERPHED